MFGLPWSLRLSPWTLARERHGSEYVLGAYLYVLEILERQMHRGRGGERRRGEERRTGKTGGGGGGGGPPPGGGGPPPPPPPTHTHTHTLIRTRTHRHTHTFPVPKARLRHMCAGEVRVGSPVVGGVPDPHVFPDHAHIHTHIHTHTARARAHAQAHTDTHLPGAQGEVPSYVQGRSVWEAQLSVVYRTHTCFSNAMFSTRTRPSTRPTVLSYEALCVGVCVHGVCMVCVCVVRARVRVACVC